MNLSDNIIEYEVMFEPISTEYYISSDDELSLRDIVMKNKKNSKAFRKSKTKESKHVIKKPAKISKAVSNTVSKKEVLNRIHKIVKSAILLFIRKITLSKVQKVALIKSLKNIFSKVLTESYKNKIPQCNTEEFNDIDQYDDEVDDDEETVVEKFVSEHSTDELLLWTKAIEEVEIKFGFELPSLSKSEIMFTRDKIKNMTNKKKEQKTFSMFKSIVAENKIRIFGIYPNLYIMFCWILLLKFSDDVYDDTFPKTIEQVEKMVNELYPSIGSSNFLKKQHKCINGILSNKKEASERQQTAIEILKNMSLKLNSENSIREHFINQYCR